MSFFFFGFVHAPARADPVATLPHRHTSAPPRKNKRCTNNRTEKKTLVRMYVQLIMALRGQEGMEKDSTAEA